MGVFAETDAAVLYDGIINKLQQDIGETLHEGDERRMFAEAIVALFVAMFNTVDDVARQTLIKYARGDILDAIGEGYDCTRLMAGCAKTTLRFSISTEYTADIVIPEGARVVTEDGHCFATDEEVRIPQGQICVDVAATAVSGGAEFNGYITGTVGIMVDLLSYVDSVQNITTTDGGTDREEDNAYRERIRLAMTKFSTAGPKDAWKYWALSADSEIADAFVYSPAENEIEITVIMKDGKVPDEGMLEKVLKVVDADDVRPLGDRVTVRAPDTSEYDIDIVYYVSNANEAEAVEAIESTKYIDRNGTARMGAVESYRLWQDTVIARDINPDRLKAFIMNPAGDGTVPGADRVEIISPVYAELTGNVVAHFTGNINISHIVKNDE